MRRGMLLLVGLGGCGVLLLALCIRVAAQYMPSTAQQYPCAVDGTPLQVVSLASYDGPFWEDGTDREVVDVAAILVENQSSTMVQQGAIVIDWGEDLFVFEFTCLPPESRTLVLESTAKVFQMPENYRCYGWSRLTDPQKSHVTVTAQNITMELHNPTASVISSVTVCYKHYYAESDTYIGGITYRLTEYQLQPGERRTVCPHHFSTQASALVCLQE